MIFHRMQEYFSPGYLSTMRSRAYREFGQQFWWEPGEVMPDRAPNVGRSSGRMMMRQDQYEKLQALSERLTDVFLNEAEPEQWPGHNIEPGAMDQQTAATATGARRTPSPP